MKRMKFKITSPEHLRQVGETLAKLGYDNILQNYDFNNATEIYAYESGLVLKTENEGNYFKRHENPEHWLIHGEFVDSSYWTAPATKVIPEKTNDGLVTMLWGSACALPPEEAITDKHYAPLPLQPREQHEADRLRELLAHINYAAENGNDPASEITLEYHDLIAFRAARKMMGQ